MIGIVSGAGPLAGLDVAKKIIEQTIVYKDQDHLPVLLFSLPDEIPDRTEFLLGRIDENPGAAIGDIFLRLEKAGAVLAAIACNTAHAQPIFQEVSARLVKENSHLVVLNIIDETVAYIADRFAEGTSIGILSTRGTHQQKLYKTPIESIGYQVLEPDEGGLHVVHNAIADPHYGIKADPDFAKGKVIDHLESIMDSLIDQGAEALLLGCTELPLAITTQSYKGIPIIDPNLILARRFIEIISPEKLR